MKTPNRNPLEKRHQRGAPPVRRKAIPQCPRVRAALERFILQAKLHGYEEAKPRPYPVPGNGQQSFVFYWRDTTRLAAASALASSGIIDGKGVNAKLWAETLLLLDRVSDDADRSENVVNAWRGVIASKPAVRTIWNPDEVEVAS